MVVSTGAKLPQTGARERCLRREAWTRRIGIAGMYAVLLTLLAMFFLTFFNRFAALRSGNGEYTAGVAFLHGSMPYRDYFTTAPPLNLLKSALLLKVFGSALIVSRAAGVAERLLIGAVLFRWLRQIFAAFPSLVASLVTIVLSAGDRTDPIASYNHDAILWAMLSGLAASFALREEERGWRPGVLAVGSGSCAALSVLSKQTVGLGAACTVLAVTALLRGRVSGRRSAAVWAAAFCCGCSVPLAGVAITLARLHLLRACLQMLFVQGPAAKAAHASDFLIRELRVGWDSSGWVVLGGFALLLGWRAIARGLDRNAEAADARDLRRLASVVLAGLCVLGLAELLRRLPALHDFSKSAVYFTLLALTGLLARYAAGWGGGRVTPRQAQSILFCALSWAIASTLSLSWPAFEAMLLPGLGLLIAAAIEGAGRRMLPFVYGALAFVVLMQVREKLDLPFGFDYQDEAAVRLANFRSEEPQLRGMRLPEATVRFVDETVATIRANTREGEPIFVYPEMGLLYALSDRTYPTISGSHNIDVLSDGFAAEEATRLRSARPAVIVYYRESEQQQRDAERLWRRGQPSGQRILVEVVEDLVKGYRLAGTYRLRAGDPEVMVYVRRP